MQPTPGGACSGGCHGIGIPLIASGQFEKAPRLLAKSEGVHCCMPEGRQILDGVAGLWCVAGGHARPKIAQLRRVGSTVRAHNACAVVFSTVRSTCIEFDRATPGRRISTSV